MKALINLESSKLLVGVFFSCFLFVALLLPLESVHAVKTTCDFQHRECFTEAGFPACYNKIDIEKYYQFVKEEKTEIAEQIIADDKKCVKLTGNEKAFLQDKSGGFVKFGIRGQNATFWAKRDALFAR
ncbi:MAG: hypothetical protein WBB48_05635 [Thermodesulfobacteriota bacterium]